MFILLESQTDKKFSYDRSYLIQHAVIFTNKHMNM